MVALLAMLCWLVAAPLTIRLAADLYETSSTVPASPRWAPPIYAAVVMLVPFLLACLVTRRRPAWRTTAAVGAACAAASGYILLDGVLRIASPPSAATVLLGESAWTIGRRALTLLLYALLVAFVVPALASDDRRSPWASLGIRKGTMSGSVAAIVVVGIATSPWPLTGALGDRLTSLNLLAQDAATVVPEQLIFWGVVYTVLTGASVHRRVGAAAMILVYAVSALGGVLPSGGLGEAGGALQRLPLALLLWELLALGAGAPALLAVAYLSGVIPRLFVDPRDALASGIPELQHVIARGIGLLAMVGLSVALRFGAPALVRLGRRREFKSSALRVWGMGCAAAAVCVWLIMYVVFGTPGFYDHGFLIVMDASAELQEESLPSDRHQRLETIYRTLADAAAGSQSDLRDELGSLGLPYRPYYLINMIRVDGHRWRMRQFTGRPDVAAVLLNPNVRDYPRRIELPYGADVSGAETIQPNLEAIGADGAWGMGVAGQGIVVGGQDTGYDWDHPALLGRYRGWDGSRALHDYNWHDSWDQTGVPFDDGSHGTHTMGTVLGDDEAGNRTGVAPEAEWMGCRNMRRGLGNPASYLECMEFFLAPYPHGGDPFHDGDVAMAPNIVNNSWACPDFEGCFPDTLAPALKVLRLAGIMMVVSAGNEGPGCETVSFPPATYGSVFAVGATDLELTVTSFSSRGPAGDLIKPDVTAPGAYVRSSVPGGGYAYAGGTSMAGPHVAGLAALLWSANPDLVGDVEATEDLICRSSVPISVEAACPEAARGAAGILGELAGGAECACGDQYGVPNNVYGCGFINATEAVRAAQGS